MFSHSTLAHFKFSQKRLKEKLDTSTGQASTAKDRFLSTHRECVQAHNERFAAFALWYKKCVEDKEKADDKKKVWNATISLQLQIDELKESHQEKSKFSPTVH